MTKVSKSVKSPSEEHLTGVLAYCVESVKTSWCFDAWTRSEDASVVCSHDGDETCNKADRANFSAQVAEWGQHFLLVAWPDRRELNSPSRVGVGYQRGRLHCRFAFHSRWGGFLGDLGTSAKFQRSDEYGSAIVARPGPLPPLSAAIRSGVSRLALGSSCSAWIGPLHGWSVMPRHSGRHALRLSCVHACDRPVAVLPTP